MFPDHSYYGRKLKKDCLPHVLELRKLCNGCPVFELCAQLGKGQKFGIWAGVLHG